MDELKEMEKQSLATDKNGNIAGGLMLIGIGAVFLAMQFGSIQLDNWWALFILIPVIAGWGSALQQVRAAGGVTNGAIRTFMGALFPLFIALIFLLEWDWGRVWPGFIILAGLNALASGWGRG